MRSPHREMRLTACKKISLPRQDRRQAFNMGILIKRMAQGKPCRMLCDDYTRSRLQLQSRNCSFSCTFASSGAIP